MNPYKLIKDMKEVGFLSPFFFKSFSILGAGGNEDEWLITIHTTAGSMYLRNTYLGYVEFCIPLLSISNEQTEIIHRISISLIETHSECYGFVSLERDGDRAIFFYHLPIKDGYSLNLLHKLLSSVKEDSEMLNEIFELVSDSESVDLDLIGDQINLMEDEELEDED